MFDIGLGETIVLVGVGFALIGRKDLPRVSRFLGTQVGRIVGLLQGARARADRFGAHDEMRTLQNELRSGLRELDIVRAEMATAMTSRGMVGRGLGSTTAVGGANHRATTFSTPQIGAMGTMPTSAIAATPMMANLAQQQTDSVPSPSDLIASDSHVVRELAPRSQAVAAVAEEEWSKQGIGFTSVAERGMGDATGSAMLANLYQQTLIHDQHDRVVQEQDEVLQSKVKEIQEKVGKKKTK